MWTLHVTTTATFITISTTSISVSASAFWTFALTFLHQLSHALLHAFKSLTHLFPSLLRSQFTRFDFLFVSMLHPVRDHPEARSQERVSDRQDEE